MSNVIKVLFGENRNEQLSIKEMAASLQTLPWNVTPKNAELLAFELFKARSRFNEVAAANVSWNVGDPPAALEEQIQTYANQLQTITYDEMTKIFFLALAYGTYEEPRGYP